jgi:prolyl-tRNA synthetase
MIERMESSPMRMSKLFGKRLKEIPADAEVASHQLMIRGGYITQLAAGIYSYLPLAWKTLNKIERIIRQEMDAAEGQELHLPALQPVELWQQSGREAPFGDNLFHLTDRKNHVMVLAPTHEEAIASLVAQHVRSYRDLPLRLYQIQTKFRDEPRPRAGLIRVREFAMKDLYSFDNSEEGLDAAYLDMVKAYKKIYSRCGLSTILIDADSGAIGGKDSQEFMAITDIGEDEILICSSCYYSANVEKAVCIKERAEETPILEMEEVETPGMKTIEEVCQFLGTDPKNSYKAVFYMADNKFIFVIIRGDLEVNETKLQKVLKCNNLRMATNEEIAAMGIVPGYASPVGDVYHNHVALGITIVADDSVDMGTNFVAGANKEGYHLKNVNYRRDFTADIMADIANVRAGDRCPKCNGTFMTQHGMEVGHVFKLGTKISSSMNANFTDKDGGTHPIYMGCYGIGVGRLMAAIVEQNHDDKGIVWPMSVSPYQVHLVLVNKDGGETEETADKLYETLTNAGIEVLYDDRNETAGIKFNDADLIGIPLRLTVSQRSLQNGGIEFKARKSDTKEIIAVDNAVNFIQDKING